MTFTKKYTTIRKTITTKKHKRMKMEKVKIVFGMQLWTHNNDKVLGYV